MTVRAALAAAMALALLPGPAPAQAIRGIVVDRGDVPVPGVVVHLLDSASVVAARALSDERGAFRLAAPRAGTWRVRTLRIGFRPVTSEALVLRAGEEVAQRLVLSGVALALDPVRVVGKSVCRMASRDSAAATYAVWEQVRTALTATQLSGGRRNIVATTVAWERTLDRTARRVLAQSSSTGTGSVAQPWRTPAPDVLRRDGYVLTDSDGSTYYAPALDMLVSVEFIEDHCFRLTPSRDSTRLGIAFEPAPDRRDVAEVRGTLWLDRRSSELRSMEFRYVNLPPEQEQEAGGQMEFIAMRDGAWAISHWSIRMPVIARSIRARSLGGDQLQVTEIKVAGGELALARRGSDTLWSHPPFALSGTVLDSLSGAPVRDARVRLSGTALEGTSDSRGRFTIGGILPGEYTVEIRTASLDSVNALHQSALAMLDSSVVLQLRVSNAATIRKQMAARTAVLAGTVLIDSSTTPIAGAEVTLPDLSQRVLTDERGAFRIAGVPPGAHRILVRRVGFGPFDASITFEAGHVVQRRVLLSRITTLDSVVVSGTSRVLGDFEENRKAGLGRFLTRDELARAEGRSMAGVMAQFPSVAIMPGRGGQGWIMSKRPPPALGPSSIYIPDEFEKGQGMKKACWPQVYLDATLMNRHQPTEPFDINTIAPERIEAVEFYAGPSETPLKYSILNSACGVLVIHSRRIP